MVVFLQHIACALAQIIIDHKNWIDDCLLSRFLPPIFGVDVECCYCLKIYQPLPSPQKHFLFFPMRVYIYISMCMRCDKEIAILWSKRRRKGRKCTPQQYKMNIYSLNDSYRDKYKTRHTDSCKYLQQLQYCHRRHSSATLFIWGEGASELVYILFISQSCCYNSTVFARDFVYKHSAEQQQQRWRLTHTPILFV